MFLVWRGKTDQRASVQGMDCLEKEIRKLWKEVGEVSNVGKNTSGRGVAVFKGRKGFCLGMGRAMSRPGNTSVKKLLSDERFVEAVLGFLRSTDVGKCKKGVVLLRDTG